MKKKWGIAAVACGMGITLAASAASLQDQEGWIHKRAAGMIVRRIEHKLNITEAQRVQIKTILETEKPTIEALVAKLQQQNAELAAQTEFDEAYVRTFAQQHAMTTADVLVEREKVRIELLHVLTPEQLKALEGMKASSRSHIDERLDSFIDQI